MRKVLDGTLAVEPREQASAQILDRARLERAIRAIAERGAVRFPKSIGQRQEIVRAPRSVIRGLEQQVREEKAQIERGIPDRRAFEIDDRRRQVGADEQVLAPQIAVDQAFARRTHARGDRRPLLREQRARAGREKMVDDHRAQQPFERFGPQRCHATRGSVDAPSPHSRW